MTGLMCAAFNGQYEITKLLLEKGALVDTTNYVSNTKITTCPFKYFVKLHLCGYLLFVCSFILAFILHQQCDIDILYDEMFL